MVLDVSASAKYTVEERSGCVPGSVTLKGPGLSYAGGWYISVVLNTEFSQGAHSISDALSRAYEAGRQSMAADLRALIGAK